MEIKMNFLEFKYETPIEDKQINKPNIPLKEKRLFIYQTPKKEKYLSLPNAPKKLKIKRLYSIKSLLIRKKIRLFN